MRGTVAVRGVRRFPTRPAALAADRKACNQQFPPQVGNYAAHAQCVNAAVERDAVPYSRHADVIRLQEQLRIKYSALIDRGALSPQEGARRMADADATAAAAMHDRDLGRMASAGHRVDRLQAMLQ